MARESSDDTVPADRHGDDSFTTAPDTATGFGPPALEQGIASVFAALLAADAEGETALRAEAGAAGEPAAGDEAVAAFRAAEGGVLFAGTTEPGALDEAPEISDGPEFAFYGPHRDVVWLADEGSVVGDAAGDGDRPAADSADAGTSGQADDGVTFRLLGELDRLWQRAA